MNIIKEKWKRLKWNIKRIIALFIYRISPASSLIPTHIPDGYAPYQKGYEAYESEKKRYADEYKKYHEWLRLLERLKEKKKRAVIAVKKRNFISRKKCRHQGSHRAGNPTKKPKNMTRYIMQRRLRKNRRNSSAV